MFLRDKPIFSSVRMLHKSRAMRVQLQKKKNKTLVVSLKRLGTKTNWLAVNRQS
jgi:hypothetical protein